MVYNTTSCQQTLPNKTKTKTEMGLNVQQSYAVELATTGKSIALIGSAGSGKSFTISSIVDEATFLGKHVEVTASTGVAATNIGGNTLHQWAGCGLARDSVETLVGNIKKFRFMPLSTYKRIRATEILIIDEAFNIDFRFLDKIDQVVRRIRYSPKLPFGGITVVFVGDPCQASPIQPTLPEPIYLFESDIWKKTVSVTVVLEQVYRQKNLSFIDTLNDIRVGDMTDEIDTIIKETKKHTLENEHGIKPTILYSTNKSVDAQNRASLKKLDGHEEVFEAKDVFVDPRQEKTLIKKFSLPASVSLKIGAQVMLLTNLNVALGLVNGTRGVVESIAEDQASVDIMVLDGTMVTVPTTTQQVSEDVILNGKVAGNKIVATRTQIPLKLAYALTIHKAQGLSIDSLIVDLKGCFGYGLAYVALSRARSYDMLRVINYQRDCIKTNTKVVAFIRSHQQDEHNNKRQKR